MTNADGPTMMMKEIVWLEKPEDIVGMIAMRRSASAVPRTGQGSKMTTPDTGTALSSDTAGIQE
jgi:hypothetical protein